MVNKPHAPRPGNKSGKKPTNKLSNADGEDTSFIVFGHDNGKPDKKLKQAELAKGDDGGAESKSKKDAAKVAIQPEAEKKPDTRTLIAGSSWTGKLPMTLFNEHCQKQRWEKPEYSTHRNPKGFTGAVILRQKNPKTQTVTELPPILPPKEYTLELGTQETTIEARHFAAAYALFRVGNLQNRAMALPPQYRDLWKGDFQQLKNDAVAQGQGYLYEADPFLAKKQHDESRAAREKAMADRTKKRVEIEKQNETSLDGQVRYVEKGWKRAPKVEMGTKTRKEVEMLVRKGAAWNPHNVRLTKQDATTVVDQLVKLGFRRSHVEEAAEICRDYEECLEWLLVHLPEDDLPKWALPENYLAGVALASGNVQREYKVQRLTTGGYSRDVCSDTLDACAGNETKAAEALQGRLLGDELLPQFLHEEHDMGPNSEAWTEELATLEAIYGDRCTVRDEVCTITLETQGPMALHARSPSHGYPNQLPIIAVEADLPAYIKLSILRRVLLHAQDKLLGEQMLFSIVDWLEREIPNVVERPDRLSDIAGAASNAAPPSPLRTRNPEKFRRRPKPIQWTPNSQASLRSLDTWRAKQHTPEQQRMNQTRQTLPAWKLQDAIVASVNACQVTIISGETGSGKSTQSVQFVLDDLIKRGFGEQAHIICTQPRRISALGLADRVADERCGRVGDEVGYAIRGETKQRAGFTKIQFVTTGVLLRRLQTSGGSAEDVVNSLADVSHVVIDEVHERSLDTDFLLVLVKDVLEKRKDLRLILMSATLDAMGFEQYFSGTCTVGTVEIQGRTYPVHDVYIDDVVRLTGFGSRDFDADSEDDQGADSYGAPDTASKRGPMYKGLRPNQHRINYDLIAHTVRYIDRELGDADGGILIFLPGAGEIDQTLRALRDVPDLHALPLHAGLQSVEQRRVFPRPPKGLRKVIAATNVAETSITIEDIVAVIDVGRVKETSFDPANEMVRLTEVWASRAACKQRRGRAGRVQAGHCYKLYTRNQETKMAERPEPEIRRVPLEQLCLSVKAMGTEDVAGFLARALTPPESLAVKGALSMLQRIGALDRNELTALGRHLSMIPADLRLGKLLVYGAAFGCLDACLTIAATLTLKSPFVSPQPKRDEAKSAKASFGKGHGDLLCDLRAHEEWSHRRSKGEPTSSLRRWCDENFLNHQTLMDISSTRAQYLSSLREIGFLPFGANAETYNAHGDSDGLLRALIAGAFQPQLARIEFPDQKFIAAAGGAVAQEPEAHMIKYFTETSGRVFVHPSSTMFDAQSFPGHSVYMSYFTKMATSKTFMRDLTPFNVYSLLMFSGPVIIDPQARGLLVDGWLRLKGWARIGVLVSGLRTMLDDLLARKVDDPGLEMSETEIVKVVRRMVEFDGLDR